jgi:hypothetical protein
MLRPVFFRGTERGEDCLANDRRGDSTGSPQRLGRSDAADECAETSGFTPNKRESSETNGLACASITESINTP